MKTAKFSPQHQLLLATIALLCSTVGCATTRHDDDCHDCKSNHLHRLHHSLHVDNCSTIPRGAIPLPAGTYLNQFRTKQAFSAEADDFVFYQNEWYKDGTKLGPAGARHLDEIVPRVGIEPFLILIEPSENNPAKDERRKWAMVEMLAEKGVPEADAFVRIGHPGYIQGITGEESELIRGQMLSDRAQSGQGQAGGFLGGGLGGFGGLGGGFGGGLGGGFGGGFGGFGGGFGGFAR